MIFPLGVEVDGRLVDCLNGHRDLCLVTMSIWPWVVPNIHSTLKAISSHENCFSHGLTKRNEQDRGHTWEKKPRNKPEMVMDCLLRS